MACPRGEVSRIACMEFKGLVEWVQAGEGGRTWMSDEKTPARDPTLADTKTAYSTNADSWPAVRQPSITWRAPNQSTHIRGPARATHAFGGYVIRRRPSVTC